MDPSGKFAITLTSLALVAAGGAITSMTFSIIHQVTTTGKVDLGETVKATLIGASGAVVGNATAVLAGSGLAVLGVTTAFAATQSFAIGAATSTAAGIAVRANSSILYNGVFGENMLQPEQSLMEKVVNDALDPQGMTIDALIGGASRTLYYQIENALNVEKWSECSLKEKAQSQNLWDEGFLT